MLILDFKYYNKLTFCLWNFAKFNVLQGRNAIFGKNIWHYYFTNGLPSVFTISLLPLTTYFIRELFTNFCANCSKDEGMRLGNEKKDDKVFCVIFFILTKIFLEKFGGRYASNF